MNVGWRGRNEIDVLPEKSDALTSSLVAGDCKARAERLAQEGIGVDGSLRFGLIGDGKSLRLDAAAPRSKVSARASCPGCRHAILRILTE